MKLLVDGCKELGISIGDKETQKFITFKNLLLEWNEKINLTSITEENEIILKHFIDSLSIMKFIDLSEKKVIDVGTGAGFPGIPLKIMNKRIEMTLLDSLNKRIGFLNEVINSLELKPTSALHGRAEDFGVKKEYRETFDICLSRAVANLATLSEYCLPFVTVGGYFISMKGPDIDEELSESKKAISILGGEIEKIEKIKLPFTDIIHSLIFIKKVKSIPSIYPRKAGRPSKDPIR